MLKFSSWLPHLTQDTLVPATIRDWSWYRRMVEDLRLPNDQRQLPGVSHTARCPGIIDVCNHGWIQKTYQDIEITTNGDGSYFHWWTPIDQTKEPLMDNFGIDYVQWHSSHLFMDFHQFYPNTLKTVIKLMSPWMISIPPGYMILAMPVPYNDTPVFTAATGILRGDCFLNAQLFWHELNGRVLLPRGTPLQQYILIPDRDVQCDIVDVTPDSAYDTIEPWRQQIRQRYGNPFPWSTSIQKPQESEAGNAHDEC